MQGCGFRDLAAEYAAKNAAIVGISFDSPQKNAAFAEKFRFDFPLLSDLDHRVALAYGAASEGDGWARRAAAVIGPDGRFTHWFAKVSAKSFPTEALALI